MPELPEVETVVRGLREPLIGRIVQGVWTDWPKIIEGIDPYEFGVRLQGQRIEAVNRRAKYILIQLTHDILVVHLRMTGRLYVAQLRETFDADKWLHLYLLLSGDRQLRFSEARKFGRVYLTDDIDAFTAKLGPEPLDDAFTLGVFRERINGRKRVIKSLLLDQAFIAGVGNIYADEALHLAKIHPQKRADALSDDEIATLYEAIRTVLYNGIEYEGATINWYRKPDGTQGDSQHHFHVYGREGQPCLVCGTMIEKIRVGQRGTHFCPHCQPA
ncbi:MAG: bifunctional DNA-formamidopyrimidine glycosylase/DNA-(apurinic or apyrimidinic site) lyase [Chloroflexi bacterium]|nr:MAG: formamidopyrimidine-DNA glycosylase [Phototrophicales bacterium]RMF79443.1 MAG: bifunctional DNA-formamidopyrimidine glycosylase/DNA-(apurinic or apyrimidinic site) lyase [Chloroflexota bacterium]